MSEENQSERTYHEISIENDDGTLSKAVELEVLGPIQFEPSEKKDNVTIVLPLRLQTFRPVTLHEGLRLVVRREIIQEMAESLGLIDS